MSKQKDKAGEANDRPKSGWLADGWRLIIVIISIVMLSVALVVLSYEVHRLRTEVNQIVLRHEALAEMRDFMQQQQAKRHEAPAPAAGARAAKLPRAATADERAQTEVPRASPPEERVTKSPPHPKPIPPPKVGTINEMIAQATASTAAKATEAKAAAAKATVGVRPKAGVLPPAWSGPSLIEAANRLDFESIRYMSSGFQPAQAVAEPQPCQL